MTFDFYYLVARTFVIFRAKMQMLLLFSLINVLMIFALWRIAVPVLLVSIFALREFAIILPVILLVIIALISLFLAGRMTAEPNSKLSFFHTIKNTILGIDSFFRMVLRSGTFLIFSYVTCFALIIALPALSLSALANFTDNTTIEIISTIAIFLTTIFAYPLAITFFRVLMVEMKNPKRLYRMDPLLIVLTLLVCLSPLI